MKPFPLSGLLAAARRGFSTSATHLEPKICVVGSGPAGYYAAQGLLKAMPQAQVDIYEKLPLPYGLVRYGVAPDHPEVKNAINSFAVTSTKENFNFFGNVNIGTDVSLGQLQDAYHAVIFCTGAEDDKKFEIPGEDLQNVLSARKFVGWYNGFPEDSQLQVNLDAETVAVFGQGNVAIDVARLLLTKVDILKKTDITSYALDALSRSRVKRVLLIGRRGPLQVAFTIKELRELFNLDGCQGVILKRDLTELDDATIQGLQRPRRRLTELMLEKSVASDGDAKHWKLAFLRSPVEFLGSSDGILNGVRLNVNRLEGPVKNVKAIATGETELLECQLVLRSIGYRSRAICPTLPYDSRAGVIKNVNGNVSERPGLYCSGWVALGPVGVILTTMSDSFLLSRAIHDDIKKGRLDISQPKDGADAILPTLKKKNVQVVTFNDWLKIDEEEKRRGALTGKPREKIVDIRELLRLAG